MLNTCAQLFVNNLKSKNLNFQAGNDKDGDSVVEFPFQGRVAKMFFSGPEGNYLSIYVVYEKAPEDRISDAIFACNDLNTAYKWVTFYVDKENHVILHDDAILSPESASDEAFELLVRILKIGEDVKPDIMRAFYA